MKKNATREELKMNYFEDDVFSQTREEYLFQKGMLLDRMHAFTQGGQPQSTSGRTTINQSLPKLNLPQFAGMYTEWINFRDLFSSMVIDKASLSTIERMHYLKMSAARVCLSHRIGPNERRQVHGRMANAGKQIREYTPINIGTSCQTSGPDTS